MSVDEVGIVGSGLVGTSIGLSLSRTGQVCRLYDVDLARAATAAAMGAGRTTEWVDLAGCDHIVVAVPPNQVGLVVTGLKTLGVKGTVSDVTSVKAQVLVDIEILGEWSERFCGGHPIAGRERGGPGAAQPELFDGAAWVVSPTVSSSPAAVLDATELARRCGGRVVTLPAAVHDRVLATVSHLPQVVASALAATLAPTGDVAAQVAGSGFRDTTRLADSDPALWTEITLANAGPLASALDDLAGRLEQAARLLRAADAVAVRDLLEQGRRARGLLPGKVAATRRSWAGVGVAVDDRPGELARLLQIVGEAGVNVEDLRIEHAPDHPVGYVDLAVREESVPTLLAALDRAGFAAHQTH